jgi:S-formylglutathione hydrolase FrmB
MHDIKVFRKPFPRVLLFVMVVCLLVVPAPANPTTQPAGDCIQTIAFAIPGSHEGKTSKAIVIVPPEYAKQQAAHVRWPVVYLLHGYTDNYETWYKYTRTTDRSLDLMAARFRTIIVLPDGNYSSWYLDAPTDAPESADWQWETVITKHLVPEIDNRFHTWAEPAGRGIAGLSMGGHGAIYLCARHPELFSACGSMSGVMDLRPFKDKYRLASLLGPYEANPQRWLEHSAIKQAENFAGRKVGIFIECGLGDTTIIGCNQDMHRKLIELNIPHDYMERPGAHNWPYWINALPYHLQFITDRLKKAGEQVNTSSKPH